MNIKLSSLVKKKNSNQYPQLTFRLSQENKESIENLLNEVEAFLISVTNEKSTKPLKRNEIITEILLEGLKNISKQKEKYEERKKTKKYVRRK